MKADTLRAAAAHPSIPGWAATIAGIAILVTLWTRSTDVTAKDAERQGAQINQVENNTQRIGEHSERLDAQALLHSEDMRDVTNQVGEVKGEVGKVAATQLEILKAIERVYQSLPAGG